MTLTLSGSGNPVTIDGTDSGLTLVRGTAKSATGTSIEFTGIPNWVKRITVVIDGLSGSGTSDFIIRLGTSSGIDATSYRGNCIGNSGGATYVSSNVTSNGFAISAITAASEARCGMAIIANLTSNTWVASGTITRVDGGGYGEHFAGAKTLSGALTQLRITTVNGTDTFDAGTINIMYE